MFEADVVTHGALARKGRGVATGKVRIEFSNVTATHVSLDKIESRVDRRLKVHVVRVSSGTGGKVPPCRVGKEAGHYRRGTGGSPRWSLKRVPKMRSGTRTWRSW
jgi:hypothetical protein